MVNNFCYSFHLQEYVHTVAVGLLSRYSTVQAACITDTSEQYWSRGLIFCLWLTSISEEKAVLTSGTLFVLEN